jgi:hypothetical protein
MMFKNFRYSDPVTLSSAEVVADFQQARLFARYADQRLIHVDEGMRELLLAIC